LKHVAESGDALFSVRAGSPRLMSTDHIREICDIAEKFCGGYLRFTSRHNVEFLLSDQSKVEPLLAELKAKKYLVGERDIRLRVSFTPGLGSLPYARHRRFRSVKAVMDELHGYFTSMTLPSQVRIALGLLPEHVRSRALLDIAILGIHRTVPKPDHNRVPNVCEIPTTVASCPTGAIRPDPKNKSVTINEEKCMYCGNCYTVCPALPLADADNDGISIWVGGKVSNARSAPKFSKLAIPFLPNNPPRWPETVAAVKKIVETYAKHARKHERMGEWIERVGWERFFRLTGIEFTDKHIDDFTLAPDTYRTPPNSSGVENERRDESQSVGISSGEVQRGKEEILHQGRDQGTSR